MSDESQPDNLEDPKPDLDEQALVGTGNEEQDDLDTAHEMETIVPSTEQPDSRNSATIQGVERPQKPVVLAGEAIPGYDLLGELGRGGMGVVYKARDQKLKRVVALKMILSGAHASDDDMQRFQIEAEAVAKLQHANIVQIYEVSEHEGRPYIALEYADGGSLDQKISGTPQNAQESARLIETLARAISLAHQQEIIHRDLKPANILLTEDGEPKITDFGLAKRLDEDSSQTKSGAVMGTPSYMAPEQAASSAKTLGPAADTYALGAILYHMLTGRPPFQAETQLDTIMQVIGEEPIAPRRLNSTLPVDLETITLKCLQKDIGRRYESAEALAEDLRRFLAREPIQARPVSLVERSWKWARRRPAIAGLIGVSMVALLIVIVGGLWVNTSLKREKDDAQLARQEAEASEADAKKGRREAESARMQAAVSLARILQSQPPHEAVPWLADDLRRSLEAGPQQDLKNRLSSMVLASLKPSSIHFMESDAVTAFKINPADTFFTVGMANGDIQRFDLATGQRMGKPIYNGGAVSQLEIDPASKNLMAVIQILENPVLQIPGKSLVRLWDLETGKKAPLRIDCEEIPRIRFSSDGRTILIAVADRVELWDVESEELVFPLLLHHETVLNASWDVEGSRIISITKGASVHYWDADTGDSLGDSQTGLVIDELDRVEFSPDYRLAVLVENSSARLLNVIEGKPVGPSLEHGDEILSISFSEDSKQLATTSRDYTARVWNTENGTSLSSPLYHPSDVNQAVFDFSGTFLATACADRNVRVWDLETGQMSGQPMLHRSEVSQLHFCGDGRRLVTGSSRISPGLGIAGNMVGAEIRLWDLANINKYSSLATSTSTRHAFFVSDGYRFLTIQDPSQQHSLESSERSPTLQLWDAASHENLFVASHPEVPNSSHLGAYLAPGGGYLVTWAGRTAWLWVVESNQIKLVNELRHDDGLDSVGRHPIRGAFIPGASVESPGGTGNMALLTFTEGLDVLGYTWPRQYAIWGLQNGSRLGTEEPGTILFYYMGSLQAYALEFPENQHQWLRLLESVNPAGQRTSDSRFDLFEATGKLCLDPRFHPVDQIIYLTTLSAVTGDWGMIRIDLSDGKSPKEGLSELAIRHRERFNWKFDRSGKKILTFSKENTARVWDAENGRPLTMPLRHHHAVVDGDFSSDGKLIVTASAIGGEGELRVWETTGGIPRTWYLSHGSRVEHVQFGRRGEQFLSVGSGEIRIWEVDSPVIETEDLFVLSELVTGKRVEQQGLLDAELETVKQGWEKYGENPRWGFQPDERQLKAWYLGRLKRVERQKQWSYLLEYAEKALQLWPDWDKALEYQSDTFARLERWPEAGEGLAALVSEGTHPPARWNSAAVAALVAGDHERYLDICRQMLERFGVEESSGWVPWTCVLDPEGTRLLLEEAPLALEAIELELEGSPFAEHVSAIILYRSGNWKEAARRLEALVGKESDPAAEGDSSDRNPRSPHEWHAWSFLARARARLDNSKELTAFLGKLDDLLSDPAEREKLDWKFRAELLLHQREAKILVPPAP